MLHVLRSFKAVCKYLCSPLPAVVSRRPLLFQHKQLFADEYVR